MGTNINNPSTSYDYGLIKNDTLSIAEINFVSNAAYVTIFEIASGHGLILNGWLQTNATQIITIKITIDGTAMTEYSQHSFTTLAGKLLLIPQIKYTTSIKVEAKSNAAGNGVDGQIIYTAR
jgi:hypothetical protein